jgi:hypothetical protein
MVYPPRSMCIGRDVTQGFDAGRMKAGKTFFTMASGHTFCTFHLGIHIPSGEFGVLEEDQRDLHEQAAGDYIRKGT